jgi:ketosteroid isomerase-like protein
MFHPDLVYHPRSDEPDPSAHIGLEAYARLVREFVDAFSEVTVEVLDLIDAGDRVIASTVIHGRIGGGGEVTDNYVFVYRLHDGLVVEGWEYRTTEEALEAVDSSE